jgi:hypothetical protein
MTYAKPELLLVGAAEGVVLGSLDGIQDFRDHLPLNPQLSRNDN